MPKELYNLQVPIDLDLAETLKELAKEDDRTLRSYCRRILQEHVKNSGEEVKVEKKVVEPVKVEKEANIEEEILLVEEIDPNVLGSF